SMFMVIILDRPAQETSRRVNHPGQFSAHITPENCSIFNAQQHSERCGAPETGNARPLAALHATES
ncbi:MAG: hypothetical protein KDH20_05020, partial [Rhodocyclaceae bacterium]|nr:hypothetical protein [Rhodocyclaceae bacterium]